MKWRVTIYGSCNCEASCIVEAESEQEAKDKADQHGQWGNVTYGDWFDETTLEADLIEEQSDD
jgi:hypothetical protein